MSDLHKLCCFTERPITKESHWLPFATFLKLGIPSTYTVEDRIIYEFDKNNNIENEASSAAANSQQLPVVSDTVLAKLLSDYAQGTAEADDRVANIASKFTLSKRQAEKLESTSTTPLHLIAYNVPSPSDPNNKDEKLSSEEIQVVEAMVDELFLNGAGWNLTDYRDKTPGCVLIDRGLKKTLIYDKILDAGVRSEMLFRKIEDNVEFIEEGEEEAEACANDDADDDDDEIPQLHDDDAQEKQEEAQRKQEGDKEEQSYLDPANDPANDQQTYLNTKLEYSDHALITANNKDGVMMNWETKLMKLGCDTLFAQGNVTHDTLLRADPSHPDHEPINFLNIGFGMGIIDTFIQEKITQIVSSSPSYSNAVINHYICEAHPDVLAKIKQDKWQESKKNVHILPGKWQDQLSELLDQGDVFFNGVYYDTFSEHYYPDMFPNLLDLLIGMLKPDGVISFFNGLGADREVVYDVYCRIVLLDWAEYGLSVKYKAVQVDANQENKMLNEDKEEVWEGVKRSYWNCPVYYHPEIKFADDD